MRRERERLGQPFWGHVMRRERERLGQPFWGHVMRRERETGATFLGACDEERERDWGNLSGGM